MDLKGWRSALSLNPKPTHNNNGTTTPRSNNRATTPPSTTTTTSQSTRQPLITPMPVPHLLPFCASIVLPLPLFSWSALWPRLSSLLRSPLGTGLILELHAAIASTAAQTKTTYTHSLYSTLTDEPSASSPPSLHSGTRSSPSTTLSVESSQAHRFPHTV
jgi:hypothetical protein